MALLRCVGATRGQVGRGVLLEALVVGVLASAVGVAAGAGLAAAVAAVVARTDAPIALDVLVVPPVAVVVGLVLGTLVTVAAAAAPARAATRVAPLAALRPSAPAAVRSRAGLVRLVLGLAVLVPSTVAMALSARSGSLTPAVGAGALSFLGFLLIAQRLVPAVVALAGAPFGRLGGVPARLAAGNASRNPRRTAATATALVIGVTLTTAMVVGAASTRASAADAIEAAYPTDVVVQGPDGVGAEVLDALRGLEQVAAVAAVDDVQVVDAAGNGFPLTGVDPAAAREVVRSQQRSPVPAQGQVVLSTSAAATLGVGDGGRLQVRADPGTGEPATGPQVELVVRVAAGTEQFAVATAADVRRAAPDARPTGAWVRLREGLSAEQEGAAVDAVTDVVAGALPASDVSGVVALRSSLDQLLTTMLLIVTGLLAVAVVIALIGVGNTLALSVVERRQESGLLRALGLTRGQLRALLAWEALLVAGVAGVVGVVLGTGYGLAGTSSVLAAEAPVVLDVPWLQVAGIVVVAALAGVLASVLPARRAANTPPVAAIAD
nr:FtsX-like permease family protein [Kineococcus vitellinus]